MSQTNKPNSSTGLEPNIAGLLCYLAGWITGIIFLIIENKNSTVRFHAVQSILVFGAITIADTVLSFVPILGIVFTWLIGVSAFVLWVVLMYRTYKGEKWVLPIAGKIAERNSKPAK